MWAALLKHPDEALMDDIGEMWSLECSPKYYVDCWMNMMQKVFDVNTENVDLVLSESQKQMENRNNWYSTEEDYKSTDDYKKNIFLGRQFKSVTLQ